MSALKCDNMTGAPACAGKVTHLDSKGYVYCASCAERRRGWKQVRRLEPIERRARLLDILIPCYERERSLAILRLDSRLASKVSP